MIPAAKRKSYNTELLEEREIKPAVQMKKYNIQLDVFSNYPLGNQVSFKFLIENLEHWFGSDRILVETKPTEIVTETLLRSPHIHKAARVQIEQQKHHVVIYIAVNHSNGRGGDLNFLKILLSHSMLSTLTIAISLTP